MYEMYQRNWQPLGEVLAKMETRGMRINRPHLVEAEVRPGCVQMPASVHPFTAHMSVACLRMSAIAEASTDRPAEEPAGVHGVGGITCA
jgi:hypothetical protein